MSIRRSVAIELAAIAAAALVFVATFRVRPAYVDLVLAAAAHALHVREFREGMALVTRRLAPKAR